MKTLLKFKDCFKRAQVTVTQNGPDYVEIIGRDITSTDFLTWIGLNPAKARRLAHVLLKFAGGGKRAAKAKGTGRLQCTVPGCTLHHGGKVKRRK